MPKTKKTKKTKKVAKKLKKWPSKWWVLMVTLAISFVGLIGGTFAWFTSADSITNTFSGSHLVAEIDETFNSNNSWKPGENTQKEVRVKNTGDVNAFVRVSLYEFLLSFQVDTTDQTGNANLKTVDKEKTPTVDDSKTNTWEPAAQGGGTYQTSGKYYVASKAWVSNPDKREGMYQYPGTDRTTAPFKYITLNFASTIQQTVPSSGGDYWLYENGYFYYSRPLKPGESTSNLLNSISLVTTIPNQFKGSLYKLKVYMDAHDETDTIYSAWSLPKDGQAYKLLASQLAKGGK